MSKLAIPLIALAAVPALAAMALFVPLLLGIEAWEWIAHHRHHRHRPRCLRCVRESIVGHDSPAGRFL